MMYLIDKRSVINFLFIVSFPVYGIGIYLGATQTPTLGYIVSMIPHGLIIVFHLIDLLYKREFQFRINSNYWMFLLYLGSIVSSLFVSLHKGLPETDLNMYTVRSFLIIAPFHAFLIVHVYNTGHNELAKLTMKGLSYLLLINLFGYYVLGMTNEVHSIEGRLNFPFLDGLYSGACLIAIINLILLYNLRKIFSKPITAVFVIIYFSLNLFFFFYINSRLVTLTLILVIILMIVNVTKSFRGVFTVSIFTLPMLLAGGLLLYEILSLPVFEFFMQRVDLLDVITFHGRSFLWQNGMDWLLVSQEGLIFGNGFKGHYFLDLFGDIIKLFDLKEVHHLHMHSTTLEVVVAQGLFGLCLLLWMMYKSYIYYKIKYQQNEGEGAFFPVMILMVFIAHVDGFIYMDSLGAMFFAFLVSRTCVSLSPVAKTAPVSRGFNDSRISSQLQPVQS